MYSILSRMLINRNAGVSKNNPHLKNEAPENSEAPVFD